MLDFTPSSVALQIGPISIYWYGICYAVGLAFAFWIIHREAKWRGLAVEYLPNGMIVVAIAAVLGGRLYHVIDQWQLYEDDPISIFLPPYTGLGAYGGLILGTIVGVLYIRWKRQPVLLWADAIAPGIFAMQAVARWGNFFNQELYGPPTTLPWGIPIECAKRIVEYPCSQYPFETTRFQPLFLYESLSGLLGMLFLIWLGRRFASRLRPGDLLLVFFIWYGSVRLILETLRLNNWTFFGVPTAQIVSATFIVVAAVILLYRHRPGARPPGAVPAAESEASALSEPTAESQTPLGTEPTSELEPATESETSSETEVPLESDAKPID
jgi:phosphatidylglycerol:prolipoprotein diacylglycerol transferase